MTRPTDHPARHPARQPARDPVTRFARDEDGAILLFWAFALAAILGIVALSFDLGRVASTQSELQSYADHVALAAAGELDGKADAITRAQGAAATLIADSQTFGTGGQALSSADILPPTFYDDLPSCDDPNNPSCDMAPYLTTDPAKAAYVRVELNPKTVPYTFGAALQVLTGTARTDPNVGAVAVAGFTQYACDITPMMFCLPSTGYKADTNVGDMILLRSGGNGAAWGPGDFGFLDPSKAMVDPNGPCAKLNGAQLDACLMGAQGSITQCFSQRGVDTEPGQKVGITDASFNVRFDIYQSIMNGEKNNPAYGPAPNVIKGIVPNGGGACIGGNPQPSSNSVMMPNDDCFGPPPFAPPTNVCGGNGRVGDGVWTTGRANYVAVNYGGTDPHPSVATRYQYYLSEIAAAAGGPILPSGVNISGAEDGLPHCSSTPSNNPDRRVIIAAGVDCTANPINGQTNNVPVEEFFRMFMTRPVGTDAGSPPTLDLWVEVIGSAGGGNGAGGTGAVFHDVVQLYR